MKHLIKLTLILLALGIVFTVAGCGFVRGDYEKPEPEKYYYNTGEPVDAVGYADSQAIQLFQLTEQGTDSNLDDFQEITNGEYISKGIHRLGIQVTPKEGSEVQTADQRVFVGDGGWDYQVEAFLNETSGLYVCDFEFQDSSIYLTHPVLIQVISPEGKASKEKFVVTTYQGLRPGSGMLVEKGMGISLSAALLDSLKESMASVFGEEETPVPIEVYEFKPAPYEDGSEGIFHLNTNIMSCDIALNDTYTNEAGEEVRGLITRLLNISGGSPDPKNITEVLMSLVFQYFGDFLINSMGMSESVVGPVAVPLAYVMAMGVTDTAQEDGAAADPMADLMQDMTMDTTLFLNLYGMPEETDENFAVIGGGIYGIAPNLVEMDDEGMTVWPDVEVDTTNTGMDLDKITNTEKGIDLGVAISQYNLNHMLTEIMRGLQMKIKDVQDLGVPIFSPKTPGNALDMIITINPGGAAMNLISLSDPDTAEPGVFAINDMRLELVEDGTQVAEISMDLNMSLNVQMVLVDGQYTLQLVLLPDYDRSYFHVLKDDLGVSAVDHSRMVEVLFSTLIGAEGEGMVLPLPLGMTQKEGSVLNPVEFDAKGNCFMNLAVESLDTSAIPGCFIDTAMF